MNNDIGDWVDKISDINDLYEKINNKKYSKEQKEKEENDIEDLIQKERIKSNKLLNCKKRIDEKESINKVMARVLRRLGYS